MKYLRFLYNTKEKLGILNGDMITEIEGNIFENPIVLQKKVSIV